MLRQISNKWQERRWRNWRKWEGRRWKQGKECEQRRKEIALRDHFLSFFYSRILFLWQESLSNTFESEAYTSLLFLCLSLLCLFETFLYISGFSSFSCVTGRKKEDKFDRYFSFLLSLPEKRRSLFLVFLCVFLPHSSSVLFFSWFLSLFLSCDSCAYLVLIRYWARLIDSGVPAMTTVLSLDPSSVFEILIVAPDSCLWIPCRQRKKEQL